MLHLKAGFLHQFSSGTFFCAFCSFQKAGAQAVYGLVQTHAEFPKEQQLFFLKCDNGDSAAA